MQCCQDLLSLWRTTAIYWPDFPTFRYSSPIWRPQWGDPLELSGSYLVWENWVQSGEGRMMIDSLVCVQYINVTDSHVAAANAVPTHCVERQKQTNRLTRPQVTTLIPWPNPGQFTALRPTHTIYSYPANYCQISWNSLVHQTIRGTANTKDQVNVHVHHRAAILGYSTWVGTYLEEEEEEEGRVERRNRAYCEMRLQQPPSSNTVKLHNAPDNWRAHTTETQLTSPYCSHTLSARAGSADRHSLFCVCNHYVQGYWPPARGLGG